MRGKLVLFLAGISISFIFYSCSNDTPVNSLDGAYNIRKNVKHLTSQERTDYVNAILLLKNTVSPYQPALSYYDQFVSWHNDAFYCDTMAAHMGPAFGPWHRQFLLMFEKALRAVSGKNITIPYWDWPDAECTNSVFQEDFIGGNGDVNDRYTLKSGPFKKGNWTLKVFDPVQNYPFKIPYLIRAIGTFPGSPTLPTREEVNRAFEIPYYDFVPYDPSADVNFSFRNYLEGWRQCTGQACEDTLMNPICPGNISAMHNRVHLWAGGMVGDTVGNMVLNASPNDPLFWNHHSNVDRLWAIWEERNGKNYAPVSGGPMGHNLNDMMWPYMNYGMHVTPKDMLDTRVLGYIYEEYN